MTQASVIAQRGKSKLFVPSSYGIGLLKMQDVVSIGPAAPRVSLELMLQAGLATSLWPGQYHGSASGLMKVGWSQYLVLKTEMDWATSTSTEKYCGSPRQDDW